MCGCVSVCVCVIRGSGRVGKVLMQADRGHTFTFTTITQKPPQLLMAFAPEVASDEETPSESRRHRINTINTPKSNLVGKHVFPGR